MRVKYTAAPSVETGPEQDELPPRDEGPSALATALSALGVFLLVTAALFVVARVSLSLLPYTTQHARPDILGDKLWFNGWFRWDGSWYEHIAHRGYFEPWPGHQSPAAYFPMYPFLMRIFGAAFHARVLGGIFVTVVSGAAVAVLYALWLRQKALAPAVRWTALLLLLLYPFAYYLTGAVYADATFIAAVLAAFLLIERDLPLLAGMAGAVATSTRPVGALLIIPLVLRIAERRGGWRGFKARDAGILLTLAGVGAYSVFTWRRYGSPIAWIQAQEGWNQSPGPATWFKTEFLKDLQMFSHTSHDLIAYLSHPVLTFVALALVPSVVRRFGWGYGSYVLVVVGLSALSTQNFFGMSRYVLAAFPVFAVAAEVLARRPALRGAWLGVSAVLLVCATSLFARGFYLS